MKHFIKCLTIYLVTIGMVHANLPPTTLKGQAETTKPTTFNFEVPYNQATTTGSGTRLIETGNDNVIKDPGVEGNTLQWSTYADAAGTAPVDGTGGTANITATLSTTSPLDGKQSLIFTKDAVNRQGQGISIPFTLPDINKGKVNRIGLAYEITSGTYASGDLSVWIINATTGRVIQPSAYTIENSGLKESKFVEFQSDLDSNTYRLVVHVTSTSALAYTVKFDSFSVGLGPKVYGSVVTDWVSFTPTSPNSSLTLSASSCYHKREGEDLLIDCRALVSSPQASEMRIGLPNNLTMSNNVYSLLKQCGSYYRTEGNINATKNGALICEAGFNYIRFSLDEYANASSPFVAQNANGIIANGQTLTFTARIPIQGWSSSQQLSQDADTRVVNFVGYVSSTQALTASVTNINLVTEKDSHGAWSGSTYTIPVAGDYFFTSGLTATANVTLGVEVYVNSVYTARAGIFNTSQTSSGAVIVPKLKAGDIVNFRASGNMTTNIGSQYKMTISRISGPSQIAASETVSARYTQSSGQSIPTSSPTVVDFNTKVYDSHNAVTTGSSWRFTAPISGEYSVVSAILFASSVWPIQRYSVIYLRKNGVNYAATPDVVTQVAQSMYFAPYPLTTKVKLLQGEYIDIVLEQNRGSATSIHNASTNNWVEINRVGNY